MSSIPAEVVNEIKQRVDIVSVVGDHVKLKRAGATFKGLCPFHTEKTPSFNVHPQKRIYHCFGCGEGGDVISFLRKVENKTFMEVLERLAALAGVDLSQYQKGADGVSLTRLYDLMGAAEEFFSKALAKDAGAQKYLEGRGFSPAVIEEFGFGFAPDSWDTLTNRLLRVKYTQEELLDAGLVRRRRNTEGVYDYFRNRIVLPILNEYGRTVGFGARLLGDGEPKYLNSPETLLYNKGRLLFNLHRAAPGTNPVDELILVEGYLDVVALHQAGFINAIASLGTALTERQVKILHKKTRRLILGYDSDRAGIQASLRALEALVDTDIEVRILNLPAGLDPDDTIREHGADGINRALETAVRVEKYLCDALCRNEDLASPDGRERVLRRMMPLFPRLPSLVAKQNLIRLMSDRLSLSEEVIRKSLVSRSPRGPSLARPHVEEGERQSVPATPLIKAEREVIRCLLLDGSLFHERRNNLHVVEFEDPFCRRVLQRLFEMEEVLEGPVYERLLDGQLDEDDALNRFITKEVVSSELSSGQTAQVVEDALCRIKKIHLDSRKRELLRLIKECSDFKLQKLYAKELDEISRTLQ